MKLSRSMASNLNFGLHPHQLPYFVFGSSDGSGETVYRLF